MCVRIKFLIWEFANIIRKNSIFCIILFSFIMKPHLAAAEETLEQRAIRYGYTYDTRLVNVKLGKDYFHIPANYLVNTVYIDKFNLKDDNPVGIYVTSPDIKPISKSNTQCFITRGICENIIQITLSSINREEDFISGDKRIENSNNIKLEDGFLYYPDIIPESAGKYYGKMLNNEKILIIYCNPPGEYSACHYQGVFPGNVLLRYNFGLRQLPESEEIYRKITDLITSFMVK